MQKTFSLLILVLASTLILKAQTKQDTISIKQAATDYVKGYYLADSDLMAKSLHPELVKRAIFDDKDGNSYIYNLGASHILHYAGEKDKAYMINPDKELAIDIIIYDIYENIACIKLTNNKFRFLDYMHLGKFKGEWKIVNVLWTRTPEE